MGFRSFFVRAVVTGDNFVGLTRLNFLFRVRWACAIFVSELRFRGLLLGFRSFLFEWREGNSFVGLLARLVVLFHFGLAQLFVEVVPTQYKAM